MRLRCCCAKAGVSRRLAGENNPGRLPKIDPPYCTRSFYRSGEKPQKILEATKLEGGCYSTPHPRCGKDCGWVRVLPDLQREVPRDQSVAEVCELQDLRMFLLQRQL